MNAFHLPHECSRLMGGKYAGQIDFARGSPVVGAAIESDRLSIFDKKSSEGARIALIPGVQQVVTEQSDFLFLAYQ